MTEHTPVLMPPNYIMDPTLDDLLFDGTRLRNGMEVLIENPHVRTPLPKDLREITPEEMHRYKHNRWAIVADLAYRSYYDNRNQRVVLVEFVGTFDDGTKAKFSVGVTNSWYVKVASIPVDADQFIENLKQAARDMFGEDINFQFVTVDCTDADCSNKTCPGYKGQKIEDKADPMGAEKSEN